MNDRRFIVLDIRLRDKFAALAVTGAAGTSAGLLMGGGSALVLRGLSLTLFPEFTAAGVACIAFVHAASATSERLAARILAHQLVIREMRAPKF